MREQKRLPQQQLNFVDGGISAHYSIVNDDKCMQLIDLANKVAAVMADIYKDKEAEKENPQQKKQQDDMEKEQRQIARLEKMKKPRRKEMRCVRKQSKSWTRKEVTSYTPSLF